MNKTKSTWYTLPFTWYDQELSLNLLITLNYSKLLIIKIIAMQMAVQ